MVQLTSSLKSAGWSTVATSVIVRDSSNSTASTALGVDVVRRGVAD